MDDENQMNKDDLTHKRERFNDAVYAATNLEHYRLSTERELQDLRWFGYRFMSPLAATRLFYDTYRKLRVDYVREHKDRDFADQLPVVLFEDYAKDPKKLAMVWSARQTADTLCVPYDLYIEFGMWFWSRRSGRGRSNTPQVNQIGYTLKSEDAWRIEFAKYLDGRLWAASRSLGNVPQLHPASFQGTPEQLDARNFLLDLCDTSERPWADAIEMWCHSYPILTPDCFAPVVPQDVLNRALDAVALAPRALIAQPDAVPSVALWPSCHGMPNAMDLTSDTCTKCHFADTCVRLASMVKAEVHRQSGHEEPRRIQLRASPNKRMREYRDNKKAAAGAEHSAPVSPSAAFSLSGVTPP